MYYLDGYKSQLKKALIIVSAPFFFVLSCIITTPYINGDQQFYRAFYEQLAGTQFSETPLLQFINTGSAEPLYGAVMWAGANSAIDKDIYIAIFNTILCCAVLFFLLKNRSTVFFIALMFSNYYLLVLLTSAERLKFSYIFLALAAASSTPFRARLWLVISPLFHFQSFILIASRVSGYLSSIRLKRVVKRKTLILLILGAFPASAAIVIFFRAFSHSLLGKIDAYSKFGGLEGVLNIALLIVASIFVFKRKYEVFIALASCMVFAIVVGPERVNMIAVSLFIYYASVYRRTSHPLVTMLMLYFSLKSIGYIVRVFEYGNGFYEG